MDFYLTNKFYLTCELLTLGLQFEPVIWQIFMISVWPFLPKISSLKVAYTVKLDLQILTSNRKIHLSWTKKNLYNDHLCHRNPIFWPLLTSGRCSEEPLCNKKRKSGHKNIARCKPGVGNSYWLAGHIGNKIGLCGPV